MNINLTLSITDMNRTDADDVVKRLASVGFATKKSSFTPPAAETVVEKVESVEIAIPESQAASNVDVNSTVAEQGVILAAAATNPAAVAVPNDLGLDKEGLPWDERIHSSNQKTKADGTWRARKGVDDDLKAAVRQELLSNQAPVMPSVNAAEMVEMIDATVRQADTPVIDTGAQLPTQTPSMPVTSTPVVAAVVSPPMPVTSTPVVQQAPVVNVAATSAAGPADFNMLLTKIQEGMAAGTVKPDYIAALVAELNVQFGMTMVAITDLMGSQPLLDAGYAILVRDGK